MWLSLPSLTSSGCRCGARQQCQHPHSFLEFHWHENHVSLPAISLLVSWLHFDLFGPFLLSCIHFHKMSHRFITGRWGSNMTTHFAVWVRTEWHTFSDPVWGDCSLIVWFVDQRASTKVCALCLYSQLIHCGNIGIMCHIYFLWTGN